MVPGSLSREGMMAPEPCSASTHVLVFARKQGWGPSKVALVSIQDSGDLAANGAGVGGSLWENGG